MKLTAELVRDIVQDCMVKDQTTINQFSSTGVYQDKTIDDTILIYGIDAYRYFFDINKLKKHENEIMTALKELPENFMQSSGAGGWSFLQCCEDRHGHQWGEHQDANMLIALGRAISKVIWLFPEPYWHALPGGVPYLMVLDGPAPEKSESREASLLPEAIKNFIGSIGLLTYYTAVFGIIEFITLPFKLRYEITSRVTRKQKSIYYDATGDCMKGVLSNDENYLQVVNHCASSARYALIALKIALTPKKTAIRSKEAKQLTS